MLLHPLPRRQGFAGREVVSTDSERARQPQISTFWRAFVQPWLSGLRPFFGRTVTISIPAGPRLTPRSRSEIRLNAMSRRGTNTVRNFQSFRNHEHVLFDLAANEKILSWLQLFFVDSGDNSRSNELHPAPITRALDKTQTNILSHETITHSSIRNPKIFLAARTDCNVQSCYGQRTGSTH